MLGIEMLDDRDDRDVRDVGVGDGGHVGGFGGDRDVLNLSRRLWR